MIKNVMQIVSAYERGSESLIDFLYKSNQDYTDLLLYYNYLSYELTTINDNLQEYEYERQIKKSFSIIPKKIETVISKDLIKEVMDIDNRDTMSASPEFIDSVKEITMTGYKFQLYYFITVLEIIMSSDMWVGEENEETFH